MARTNKTLAQKEEQLLAVIHDAKKKLGKLQDKVKLELGELACKHGLHNFEINTLEEAFKKLKDELTHETQRTS